MKNIKFAIEYLKNNSHKMIENGNNYATQSVNLAIEALEKKIPKKPEKQDENCLECPNCDSFLAFESEVRDDTSYQDEYCRNCGQAIDWE
ncbi:MAG TPA: hypothetical protein VFD33_02430 [Bacillota bacterium]|nr:hypothetical protein [Bacillota bacterium]